MIAFVMAALMATVDINPFHLDIFQSTDRELIVYGGRGAGKSFSIAQKIILLPSVHHQLGIDKPLKVIALRKTLPSLKASSMEIIKNEAERFGLRYELNKQDLIGRIGPMQILYRSANNTEDIERIKSVTDVDFIWPEELNEFRESDYNEMLMVLRGGHGHYKQIVGSLNPVGKTSWVYKRFFERNIGNAKKLKYTVDHNPFLKQKDPAYVAQLDRLKEYDLNLWNIYRNGEWGELSGVIYNWDITDEPQSYDEAFYGLDFGYSVDPCSLVKVFRKADEYWVKEIIYQTGLTNIDIANRLIALGINRNDVIYADSAEPKSIDEIYSFGFNIQPCQKGPDSIRAGIDFIKSQKVHIIDGSENVIREARSYVWRKDKDGNSLNEPIGINNHACFVGNTKIMTSLGPKRIDKIKIGDLVYTRFGFQKVADCAMTGIHETNQYMLNQITIKSTSDHPMILSDGHRKEIGQLTLSDMQYIIYLNQKEYIICLKNLIQKQLSLMESSLNDTQIQKTDQTGFITRLIAVFIQKAYDDFTHIFGKKKTEKFQKDISSITLTEIRLTTICRTLLAYWKVSMFQTILDNIIQPIKNKHESICVKFKNWLQNGINQNLEKNGIEKMPEKTVLANLHMDRDNAQYAVKNLLQKTLNKIIAVTIANLKPAGHRALTMKNESVKIAVNHSQLINIQKQLTVQNLVQAKRNGNKRVYNLTVENHHEYFANGLLVSNCDAIRYAIHTHMKQEKPQIFVI